MVLMPVGDIRLVLNQRQKLAKPSVSSKNRELIVPLRPSRYDCGMDYQGRITIEPGKRGGKPCIRGLRITVYDVLEYLASGMTECEILSDFPELAVEDIRACLAFAADRERKLFAAAA